MQRSQEFKGRVTRPAFNQQDGKFFMATEPHPFRVVQPQRDAAPEDAALEDAAPKYASKKANGHDEDTA